VLGQIKVAEKSNEIVAIPKLLDLLAIEGAIVSIDAMGCQRDIAKKIIDNKVDYVLASKAIKARCARMSRSSSPSRRPIVSRILRSVATRPSTAITAALK
jgi:predicted transposase YbfD/YdcC